MQLDIDFSRSVGDDLANKCAQKAKRVSNFDSEGASRFIHGWLIRHGQMSGEALTDAAKEHGYRPHDDRAFGSVFSHLVRRQCIECVGYGVRAKGHGTGGLRIWRAID